MEKPYGFKCGCAKASEKRGKYLIEKFWRCKKHQRRIQSCFFGLGGCFCEYGIDCHSV